MAARDKRTFYLYCPPVDDLTLPGVGTVCVPEFPFLSPASWASNQGFADINFDTVPPNIGNQDETADWAYVCVVDATSTGGSTTSDTSDRCNTQAESIESTTSDFSGTINLTPDRKNRIDHLVISLCNKYEQCEPFMAMMLDCPRNAGGQGRWIYGTLKSWNETQGLNATTQITFNITPEPLPGGLPNQGKIG